MGHDTTMRRITRDTGGVGIRITLRGSSGSAWGTMLRTITTTGRILFHTTATAYHGVATARILMAGNSTRADAQTVVADAP